MGLSALLVKWTSRVHGARTVHGAPDASSFRPNKKKRRSQLSRPTRQAGLSAFTLGSYGTIDENERGRRMVTAFPRHVQISPTLLIRDCTTHEVPSINFFFLLGMERKKKLHQRHVFSISFFSSSDVSGHHFLTSTNREPSAPAFLLTQCSSAAWQPSRGYKTLSCAAVREGAAATTGADRGSDMFS